MATRNHTDYHENSIAAREDVNKGSIRSSLTPQNFQYPKKQSEREVKTSKASESKGKELFVSTGRYGNK